MLTGSKRYKILRYTHTQFIPILHYTGRFRIHICICVQINLCIFHPDPLCTHPYVYIDLWIHPWIHRYIEIDFVHVYVYICIHWIDVSPPCGLMFLVDLLSSMVAWLDGGHPRRLGPRKKPWKKSTLVFFVGRGLFVGVAPRDGDPSNPCMTGLKQGHLSSPASHCARLAWPARVRLHQPPRHRSAWRTLSLHRLPNPRALTLSRFRFMLFHPSFAAWCGFFKFFFIFIFSFSPVDVVPMYASRGFNGGRPQVPLHVWTPISIGLANCPTLEQRGASVRAQPHADRAKIPRNWDYLESETPIIFFMLLWIWRFVLVKIRF